MAKKKAKEDPSKVDVDSTLKEAVACSYLGRALASYAAMITNREKAARQLVYEAIRAGNSPSEDLAVIAETGTQSRQNERVYTDAKAIEKFVQEFPEESQPLQRLRDMKHTKTEPVLNYGVRPDSSLDEVFAEDYMVDVLQRMLPVNRRKARSLYNVIIRPQLERDEEERGIVTVKVKS